VTPDVERYDILVIGSGESGKHSTWNMAEAARRTAVAERKYIGGSYPNIACLPRKNVIRKRQSAGTTMKMVENAILGVGMQAVAEAAFLGEIAGLSRAWPSYELLLVQHTLRGRIKGKTVAHEKCTAARVGAARTQIVDDGATRFLR
jgi:hypothetical protein